MFVCCGDEANHEKQTLAASLAAASWMLRIDTTASGKEQNNTGAESADIPAIITSEIMKHLGEFNYFTGMFFPISR